MSLFRHPCDIGLGRGESAKGETSGDRFGWKILVGCTLLPETKGQTHLKWMAKEDDPASFLGLEGLFSGALSGSVCVLYGGKVEKI